MIDHPLGICPRVLYLCFEVVQFPMFRETTTLISKMVALKEKNIFIFKY